MLAAAAPFFSPFSRYRQVSAIARAVMEQLQEEKTDEIAALKAEIYAEAKVLMNNLFTTRQRRLQHSVSQNISEPACLDL